MLKTDGMALKKNNGALGRTIVAWIARRYPRQGLWSLFLMCAFPLHAWTLILAFRDISWLTERTNAWDAVGVLSYGLVFAFVESLLLWAVTLLLGYLVGEFWEPQRRVALMTVLVLGLSIWAMLEQLFFLVDKGLPAWIIGIIVRSGHPLWVIYGVLLALLGISLALPTWVVLRSNRAYAWVRGMIERLSLLTTFYLILDAIGLVIVIIRNS